MKPRTFAAIVAAAFLLASLLGLVLQVHASYDYANPFNGAFGVDLHEVRQSDCGTGLSANGNLGDIDRQNSCDSAVAVRRAWTIPLGVLGVIGLTGVLWIQPSRRRETAA